jgi:hypothetical protein
LRQALEPLHRLLCDYDPLVGGVLIAFPQPMGHIVVGPDPGLLEGQTETLDMISCMIVATSAYWGKLFTIFGFTPQSLVIGYYWLLLLLLFCKKFCNYWLLLHHAQTLIIAIIAYLLLQLIVSA